ncbi:MAG: chorismate synthase [Nitrospirota bacterium]
MIEFLTAGESHGRCLIGILEGIPSGLMVIENDINKELIRRQKGFGRGSRMEIEEDKVEILSGVRWGKTLGSPIAILIQNKDWLNWEKTMSVSTDHSGSSSPITRPRPGHADLSGVIKYGHKDIRDVLERSSARETAMRVALGAIAKKLLAEFGIRIISHVIEIGGVKADITNGLSLEEIEKNAEASDVRCADSKATKRMIQKIKEIMDKGDSLGGIIEIIASRPPVGLGSYVQWNKRIDARLTKAIMSIQAIKGVEIGLGFQMADKYGSEVHDQIYYDGSRFYRKTNRGGGIEGGMTNGEDIILRAVMKPIPTLRKPLKSVDFITKETFEATYERSDVCAVSSAGVVCEAMVALELANAITEKFGEDSLEEMKRNYKGYIEYVKSL